MKNTKLSKEDQTIVDEYINYESITPRKKFRPWILFCWLTLLIITIGVASRITSYLILNS
jgi:hypothetical protein